MTLGEFPAEPHGAKTGAAPACSLTQTPAELQHASTKKKKKARKQPSNSVTSAVNFCLEYNLLCRDYRVSLKFAAADPGGAWLALTPHRFSCVASLHTCSRVHTQGMCTATTSARVEDTSAHSWILDTDAEHALVDVNIISIWFQQPHGLGSSPHHV